MADVTLTYKGSDILELSNSGSATLKTGGKYCEDDIAVEYVKPSGGGSQTITATFDNVISTNGGRTAPFYAIANLLQFRNFEAVGYAYKKGQTSQWGNYRINYGLTTTQFTSAFRINQDGDTTTKFKLTGVTENGIITYNYYYDDVLLYTSQASDAYNGFAFHWLSDVNADTEIVIHVDITGT